LIRLKKKKNDPIDNKRLEAARFDTFDEDEE